jgi:hypothetical protein
MRWRNTCPTNDFWPVPGWLVVTDMWFPGWTCTVDGEVRLIYPWDYLFRAIQVPAGRHEVVFRFQPFSYRLGQAISGRMLVILIAWELIRLYRRFLRDLRLAALAVQVQRSAV